MHLVHPLTWLICKIVPFIWTHQCKKAFETLKERLMKGPLLVFPDPGKPYTLFTAASKYAWSVVLTQETVKHQHPINYISELFHWAALIKEAYDIYMVVKILSLYSADAKVTM